MCGKARAAIFFSAVLTLCFHKPCSASASDSIIKPVGATASSTWPAGIWGWEAGAVNPQYMIDGSGLTGTGRTATHTTANDMHLFWHSDLGVTIAAQWLEFDLGAAYDVTNALIWQLAQSNCTTRGIKEFRISVAGTDHVYSTYSIGNLLNMATNPVGEAVQVVPLAAKRIQYVRFEIQSNYGDGNVVGLSEVRFEGALSAPPPATMVLLPVDATASSTYDPASGFVSPLYMIDGSGLTGIGSQATHMNANERNLFWHSNVGVAIGEQWVEFDLGAAYDVTNALIWQLAQAGLTARGVQDFTISVAGPDEPKTFRTYSTGNRLNQATGDANEPVQVVPLVARNIRYVRIEILSDWGSSGEWGCVGLSEVQFEVAVPELNPAAVTLAPVSASASTAFPYMGYYESQFVIDGSGLTGTGRRATHSNANGWGLFWNSDVNVVTSQQWIEFDLGAVYDVTNALIWQLVAEGATKTGVKVFSIRVAGSDHTFSTYSTDNMLNQGSSELEQFPRVLPLVAKNIRYVRLEIQSNWGRADGSVGLSEVRFEVAPPETNAFIRIPVGDQVSSSYVASKGFLIDGSGLTGTGLAATHGDGLGETSMWLSNYGLVTNEWIEFDLGAEMKLVSAAIWQYNQTRGGDGSLSAEYVKRGVKNMTIYTAGNDKSYTEYGRVQLARATGFATEPVQLVQLKVSRAWYVKFAVNSNWGFPDMVGLSEVRFLYERTGTLLSIR